MKVVAAVSFGVDPLGVRCSYLFTQLFRQLMACFADAFDFFDTVVQRRKPSAQFTLESRQLVTVLLNCRLQRIRLITPNANTML